MWLLESETLTPNADRAVEEQELSFTVGGNAEWYSHVEESLGVSWQS